MRNVCLNAKKEEIETEKHIFVLSSHHVFWFLVVLCIYLIVFLFLLNDLKFSLVECLFFKETFKGVLCIPQSSSITGTSPPDCLVSYPGYPLGRGFYPSAEVQLVYSTAPPSRLGIYSDEGLLGPVTLFGKFITEEWCIKVSQILPKKTQFFPSLS